MFWLLRNAVRTSGPRKPPRKRPVIYWVILAVGAPIVLIYGALTHHPAAAAAQPDTTTQNYYPPITCHDHGPGWIDIQQTAQFPDQTQKRYGWIQVTSTSRCTGDLFTYVMTPTGSNFGIDDGWTWTRTRP